MYPLTFGIDYPAAGRSRLSVFFRPLLAIPIVVVLTVLSPMIVSAAALTIVFRRKYPRWWFDFNVEWARFSARVSSYLLLLRDEYPATDDEQAVRLNVEYPENLNRFLPLVKWLLAIPHYVVLSVLGIIVFIVTGLAWLLILVTGSYPRGLFGFVVGVSRWSLRVQAYAITLWTDQYPPFRLSE